MLPLPRRPSSKTHRSPWLPRTEVVNVFDKKYPDSTRRPGNSNGSITSNSNSNGSINSNTN